jgi:hypothetical protein
MAVSSPYAVFRASDVCWPLVLQPAWATNRSPLAGPSPAPVVAQGRQAQQASSPWRTMVQGELFQTC